jgi:hypothetical protein
MDPINYSVDVQTPIAAAAQGYQLGAGMHDEQFKQQQQQAALQQQQQQAQVIRSLISNPNAGASDYANAALLVPGMREQFKQAWEQKNSDQQQSDLAHTSQVYAALKSGNPDVAVQLLNDRATALRNSGNEADAKHADAMAGVIQEHPELARTMVGLHLSAVPGGDKIVDQARQLGNDPANAAKLAADASLAQTTAGVAAATAPDKVAAAGLANKDVESQIADRSKRFGLDVDKFRSETGLKVTELQDKLGQLPEFVAKDVTTAATDSIAAAQSAAKMTDLAARLDALDPASGLTAKGAEAIKRVTGNQNEVSRIRAEYNRLVTPAAMAAYKTVASGSTSDKDIETAMTGVPNDTADASTMSSFLRGAAKLQIYDSVVNNAKSEWLQAVRSLGKSKNDISVDGVTVPAGTTFKAFTDAYVAKKVQAQVNAATVAGRGYMKYATPADAAPAPLTDALTGGAPVAP